MKEHKPKIMSIGKGSIFKKNARKFPQQEFRKFEIDSDDEKANKKKQEPIRNLVSAGSNALKKINLEKKK